VGGVVVEVVVVVVDEDDVVEIGCKAKLPDVIERAHPSEYVAITLKVKVPEAVPAVLGDVVVQ